MNKNNNPSDIAILENISSITGIYEKIFGRLLDRLVFDQDLESKVDILEKVYGMEDARAILGKKIERKEFTNLTSLIFKYQVNQNVVAGNGGETKQ